MRIALVSREVIPFFGAGIGTYAAEMSRAWAAAGHEVHVLSENHPGFTQHGPAQLAAACHAVPPRRHRFPHAAHSRGVRRALRDLHARSPFDYIEFPDYGAEGHDALLAARSADELHGAVLGIRLHTPTFECRQLNGEPPTPETTDLQRREDQSIQWADLVTSPSRSLLDRIHSRLPLRGPTAVVPYPFRPDSITAPNPVPCHHPTVLYYGRLERRKGVDLLIHAALDLLNAGADLRIRLIGGDTRTAPGGGSMLDHLRAAIPPHWASRFTFDPRKPRAEVFNIVRGITERGGVCCFPSTWENFPNVCLEAMSLGACVIGSDAGGMAEIIEDGRSGLLFRAGNPSSLADALARALRDDHLRQTLAAAAPARIAALCEPPTIVSQMTAAIETARRAQHRPPASIGRTILRRASHLFLGRP
jgi:glycosyltransferase involved in cell wall biosynthesis